MDACNTCQVFDAYVINAESYLSQFLSSIHGPMVVIAVSLAALWAVWQGIKMTLGALDVASACITFVFLVLGLGVLQAWNTEFALTIFRTAIDLMSGISALAMQSSGVSVDTGSSGLAQLVGAIEASLMRTVMMGVTIMQSASWTEIIVAAIYALGLLVPVLLLMIKYVSTAIISLFRLTVFGMLSPYIIAVASFPWGRSVAQNTVASIMNAIVVMVTSTAVMGLVMSVIGALVSDGSGEGNLIDVTNGTYMMALILAWCGVALLGEASNIADRVTGGLLGSDGSSSLVGGIKNTFQKGSNVVRSATSKMSPTFPESSAHKIPNHVATDALKGQR